MSHENLKNVFEMQWINKKYNFEQDITKHIWGKCELIKGNNNLKKK